MIEIKDVSKQFGKTRAVDHVSFSVKEENVFGLIGTNGAGKSTMLRMLAGVLKPDAGLVLIDGMQVYDNVNAKKMFFFIGDEPYFFFQCNAQRHGEILQQCLCGIQQRVLLSVSGELRSGQQTEDKHLLQGNEKAAGPYMRDLLRNQIFIL